MKIPPGVRRASTASCSNLASRSPNRPSPAISNSSSADRTTAKPNRWLAFLNNHREVIAAFDFFTVPTLTFQTLYCCFVVEHGRRRLIHFNCTAHPTSEWVVQQLRQALPLPCPYRYALFDHDAKFGRDV